MFIINIAKMSILQIKKKILNDFFFLFVCVCESRKPHPKIHVESQETSDNQDNLVKEEQTFRIHTFWLHNLLKNFSNQNNMGLAYIYMCVCVCVCVYIYI